MNILLIGYGAMNQRVARLAEDKGHEIVGVIELQKRRHLIHNINTLVNVKKLMLLLTFQILNCSFLY